MHPTGELGDVLFADYLMHFVAQAERALLAADGGGGSGSGGGGNSACAACPQPLAQPPLPAAALHPGGRDVYRMRCYGSAGAPVRARTHLALRLRARAAPRSPAQRARRDGRSRRGARPPHNARARTHVHTHTRTHTQGNFLPGRSEGGDYTGQVVGLNIVSSRGFEFHDRQVHGNTRRVKPGWCARPPHARGARWGRGGGARRRAGRAPHVLTRNAPLPLAAGSPRGREAS